VLLPELGRGEPLVAGLTASSAALSLTLTPEAEIEFDRLTYQGEAELALRAVQVPLEGAPEVIDPALGFELVYAATPMETRFCPPAQLKLENLEGWEPETEVEIWLHGIDITEEWAPYGGWAKVSEAVVSADGRRIESTVPGLPVLGVLGFKRR
jgi:hypothetical protein